MHTAREAEMCCSRSGPALLSLHGTHHYCVRGTVLQVLGWMRVRGKGKRRHCIVPQLRDMCLWQRPCEYACQRTLSSWHVRTGSAECSFLTCLLCPSLPLFRLAAGADANKQDSDGETALHKAASAVRACAGWAVLSSQRPCARQLDGARTQVQQLCVCLLLCRDTQLCVSCL